MNFRILQPKLIFQMSGQGKGWVGKVQKGRAKFVDGKQKEANRLRMLRTSSAATSNNPGNVICAFMNFPVNVIAPIGSFWDLI